MAEIEANQFWCNECQRFNNHSKLKRHVELLEDTYGFPSGITEHLIIQCGGCSKISFCQECSPLAPENEDKGTIKKYFRSIREDAVPVNRTVTDKLFTWERFTNFIVFIDIIGFSTRRLDEQFAILTDFNRVVVNQIQFLPNTVKTITLPTGDGCAICLFNGNPEYAAHLAININNVIKGDLVSLILNPQRVKYKIRTGIHTANDRLFVDMNGNYNVCGHGINTAARIESIAGEMQIYLSNEMALALQQTTLFEPLIGVFEEKVIKGRTFNVNRLHYEKD